jgi:hypothetical protein
MTYDIGEHMSSTVPLPCVGLYRRKNIRPIWFRNFRLNRFLLFYVIQSLNDQT